MPPVLPTTTGKCGHYTAIFHDIDLGLCYGPSDEIDREEKVCADANLELKPNILHSSNKD